MGGALAVRILMLALCLTPAATGAQTLPKPKPKISSGPVAPKPRPMGVVKINTESDCTLVVNEESMGALSVNEVRSLRLPEDTYLFKAIDAAGAVRWSQWITVRAGNQAGITVRFSNAPVNTAAPIPPVLLPVGASLIQVAGGTFEAGCPPHTTGCNASELPRRRITLTRGFWMLATPVTVGQYKVFARDRGVNLTPEQQRYSSQGQPFLNVTWTEAAEYCSWMQGRLPTEAEWERASQGAVDGIGRIWEWTSDWHNRVPPASSTDPTGPGAGQNRVVRMGDHNRGPRRDHLAPDRRYEDVGFRCVTDRPR